MASIIWYFKEAPKNNTTNKVLYDVFLLSCTYSHYNVGLRYPI